MKRFKGNRPLDAIVAEAKANGWDVDMAEFDAGGDGVWFRDMDGRFLQVRFNCATGAFAVWNPGSGDRAFATHISDKFDGEPWYDELLNLFYEPATV